MTIINKKTWKKKENKNCNYFKEIKKHSSNTPQIQDHHYHTRNIWSELFFFFLTLMIIIIIFGGEKKTTTKLKIFHMPTNAKNGKCDEGIHTHVSQFPNGK